MLAYADLRILCKRRRRGPEPTCCRSGGTCLHTSAYVSIRQHTSAYVSIRQHTSAYVSQRWHVPSPCGVMRVMSVWCLLAYVSIRQHTSAYVSIRVSIREHTCEHVPSPCGVRRVMSVWCLLHRGKCTSVQDLQRITQIW
jgi:hypothetical protein